MLRAGWLLLCAALCSLLLGQAEAPSPGVPPERSRPYAVLRGQNLGERGGPRAGSPTGARWRVRGAAGGGGSCPGRAVLAELVFLLSAPSAGCRRHLLELEAGDWVSALRSSSAYSG